MPVPRLSWSLLLGLVLTLTACERRDETARPAAAAPEPAPAATAPVTDVYPIDPANWPQQAPPLPRNPDHEQRIADLLARMTLEEKVGQVLQADIATVTPQDVRDYHLGSVLNGGGSAPKGDLRGQPQDWLELADAFWEASSDTADGGSGIPVIWGTDAVHGHSNIVGATVFPHNIGLGAANDPDLVYEIGRVTALEIAVTGLDWTFAPTLAVVRNDRWGRSYEGYSEDPRIVAAYAPRVVEGLQGRLGTPEFLAPGRVLACAKHFVGDGGTYGGDDQGDNRATEAQLRDLHAAGYPPAIAAGVQTVMASFNSFHGRKMHGSKPMLTDVLVGRMGFDGFVVGDWNGHGQVEGCSNESCAAAFNAGLDMFMVPDDFKALYRNTLDQVRAGTISEARLDEAVARILRVKLRAGIFEAPRPSQREYAGRWELLGAPEHRAIAREAVRRSLVLLKNDNGLLPIAPGSRVLVAGDGADDIGKQSGGWTLSWQGTGNRNEHFPNGQSIYDGIREAVEAHGGRALLSIDGSWDEKPDVAIVVFGENPYAEGVGDRSNVDYTPPDGPSDGLELLQRLRQDGVSTVSVFLSGRPLWANPELNASDAFVAAWLPGSEGGGVADVLIAAADGSPRHDFDGRLSFSWPASAAQVEVNVDDDGYRPLFPYGFGLSYEDDGGLGPLPEDPGLGLEPVAAGLGFIEFGDPVGTWRLGVMDRGGETTLVNGHGTSPSGQVSAAPADDEVQEDSLRVTWTGPGSFAVSGPPADLQGAAASGQVLALRYRVIRATSGAMLSLGSAPGSQGELDVGEQLAAQQDEGWRIARIPVQCFAELGSPLDRVDVPLALSSWGALDLQIAWARLEAGEAGDGCAL